MKKETYNAIKSEWKKLLDSSEKPDSAMTLVYLCLIKDEKTFMKSYTKLSNKTKLQNTIYDYNFDIVFGVKWILNNLSNHINYNRPVTNVLLNIALEDDTFDIVLFHEKVEILTLPFTELHYQRMYNMRKSG